MKRYTPIFESLDNIYDGYAGRKIIITNHAYDRFFERFPENQRKELLDKILWVVRNGIKEITGKYKDNATGYVIYSKSTGICLAINWRRQGDPRLNDGNNHAVVVTITPLKRTANDCKSKPSDIRIIVEQQLLRWAEEQLLKDYRNSKVKRIMESTTASMYVRNPEEDCYYSDPFFVVIDEGKIWDSSVEHYVLVE